jgi:SAM-dependent methyltransferase
MVEKGWPSYLDVVAKKCFDCISSKSRVLEIGAGRGRFTAEILKKNPAKLVVIEPNDKFVRELSTKFNSYDNVELKEGDFFDLIDTFNVDDFDVVVAFGVLYHWSSPFHFLELVVNYLDPKYFCIDNPDNYDVVIKYEDTSGVDGNYINQREYRTVNLSTHLPTDIVVAAMNNLGYSKLLKRDMSWHCADESKQQTILFKFEKENYDK